MIGLSKLHSLLKKFTVTDARKPELEYFCIRPNEGVIEATDGAKLIRVPIHTDKEMSGFPKGNGKSADPEEDILLPACAVDEALKLVSGLFLKGVVVEDKSKFVRVRQTEKKIVLSSFGRNKICRTVTVDKRPIGKMWNRAIGLWQTVKDRKYERTIWISGKLLFDIANYAKTFGVDGYCPIIMKLPENHKDPILFEIPLKYLDGTIEGIIMPMEPRMKVEING